MCQGFSTTASLKRGVIRLSIWLNVLLFFILFTPLTAYVHRILFVDDPPRKGDAVVVLSSNFPIPTKNGVLDFSTMMRLEKGLRLYRAGLVPKIICFGGIDIPGTGKTTAEAMRERLLLYGVPESDIIVQDGVKGKNYYYENLLLMMRTYGELDWSTVMFVTSADHGRRIKKCLKSEIADPVVVASEPYEFYADWGPRLQLFRRAMNEIFFAFPFFEFTGKFKNS